MRIRSALCSILFDKVMKISVLNNLKYTMADVLVVFDVDIIKIEPMSYKMVGALNSFISIIFGFVIIYLVIDIYLILIVLS